MLLLGLTGSIATGKSSVSNILSAPPYSIPIIDADLLARKVVEPGTPGYNSIVQYFGPTTPDLLLAKEDPACGGREDGKDGKGRPLDRPALGRRVFGENKEMGRDRKVLNGIIHPAVAREMCKAMVSCDSFIVWRIGLWLIVAWLYYYLTGYRAVVLDVPLLFESGWDRYCGTVLVVAVSDPEVQMRRLRERDRHLSAEDAKNRVLSQGDVRVKVLRALARGPGRGVVVWNDGDKNDLKKEIAQAVAIIQKRTPRWWSWLCLLCPPVGATAAIWTIWKNHQAIRTWEQQQRTEKAKL